MDRPDSNRHSVLLTAAWAEVGSTALLGVRAGPEKEKSPAKELSFGLVCSETSQEKELVAFHYRCREGTCEFLGESFSLWWSVNKHKMHVSFGSGFYSQMNEFE